MVSSSFEEALGVVMLLQKMLFCSQYKKFSNMG